MSTKTKTSKTKTAQGAPKMEDPEYPIQFMRDLAQNAYDTVYDNLKKAGVDEQILRTLTAIHSLQDGALHILENGGKTSEGMNEVAREDVATAVKGIALLGGKLFV